MTTQLLADALPELPKAIFWARNIDGRLELRAGEKPPNRAGGYASPWAAMYDGPSVRDYAIQAIAEHDAQPAPAPVQPPANGDAELPPLPDRFDSVSVDDFTGQRLSVYTASQMEAYARAAIAARTCPLPAHWRMAIEEWEGRMLPSPRKLKEICDLIEQRARQMAKAGGDPG